MKIDLMIIVAMVVLHSKKHILWLVWVLVFSIGFYGVKGGLFTLATGGSFRVWGPMGSYIEGNNEIALALVMIIPLMRFLHLISDSVWIKRGLLAAMVLCAVAALGSQSRGALLAIAAMAAVMWWRADRKALGISCTGGTGNHVALVHAGHLVGTHGNDRHLPGGYISDGAYQCLVDGLEPGIGQPLWWRFHGISRDAVSRSTRPTRRLSMPRTASTSWCWVSMASLDCSCSCSCGSSSGVRQAVCATGQEAATDEWLSHLGAMCQVSLAGYAVGGAFLSLSYYDLPYNILVLVVLGCRWMDQQEWVVEEKVEALAQEAAAASVKRRWIA